MPDAQVDVECEPTDAQVLRALADKMRISTIYLRRGEKLESFRLEGGVCTIKLRVYRFRESYSRTTITGAGHKLLTWRFDFESLGWRYDPESFLQVWDTDFKPIRIVGGRVENPQDYADRLRWEAICNRPGTARYPLHSADRVLLLGADTVAMGRHWAAHNRLLNGE